MGEEQVYLAVDLGAESGRVLAGKFNGETLDLEELNRFPNLTHELGGSLHWDVQALFHHIKQGIGLGVAKFGDQIEAIGIDTWGVDYALLDANGRLLGLPHCYRDPRTEGIEPKVYERMSREELYGHTGIQTLFLNTSLHLFAQAMDPNDPRLDVADKLLFIPDLLNYWLCGEMAQEYSIASTSQLLDMSTRTWSKPVLDALNIPDRLFGEITEPGTRLGTLRPAVREELKCGPIPVITVAGHDTASAVAAVPTDGSQSFAYLSSGTWSLMGIEADAPSVDQETLDLGFTNEGGVCGTIRKLRNISGLWLVQECKREWAREGTDLDYATLTHMASEAPAFSAVIDADHPPFVAPGKLPAKIAEFCTTTGQKPPPDKGATVRTALESLALKYRLTHERLEALAGHRLDVLHIVGGGTQNKLLNQMAASALDRPVITGPVEATAVGNVLMQMIACGTVGGLDEARGLVRASFEVETYAPQDAAAWREASDRLAAL